MTIPCIGPCGLRSLLAALALALLPAAAAAQTGRIAGTVEDAQGRALVGAQVVVVGTRLGALTAADGAFVVNGVPAGTRELRVIHLGYREAVVAGVEVPAGGETTVTVVMEEAAVQLAGVVVSASRRAERITDAPATITRIDAATIANSVGNSFGGALKEVKGLDFIQVGATAVAVNARGFNSSFNNRMLMMEDGRISVLPENGLPVGQFTPTPKVDIAGLEVLVGPGSALYGADASSGVVSLTTKDPRDFPGTTVEVVGGSRSYFDIQARHAGVSGDWGYKVSGEWQQVEDWSNRLSLIGTGSRAKPYEPGDENNPSLHPEVGPGGEQGLDWDAKVLRGSGALVRYGEDSRLELKAGASVTDAVGQTNVGRNQLDGWQYNFQQLRYSRPHLFVNLYRGQSKSGDSYANNRYTLNEKANRARPDDQKLSDEELILASDWPSDGRMYAAEVQTNWQLPRLLNSAVVLGAQYRQDVVSSDRQWLTDRKTGEDVSNSQYGIYGQTTTPVMPWLDLVLAARLDDHENYETQFSPKAGLVAKPTPDHAFRVTYNRAFKSPTILQTDFYIPDWTPVVAIFGNTRGYTIRREGGDVHRTYDPLRPEENVTWEFGYKGVIGNRLFVDVAHYRSDYTDFISPLSIVSDPFGAGLAGQPAGTKIFAYDADGELVTNEAGGTPLVLIYYNLGEAKLVGTDAGVNFLLTPRINLRGTLSTVSLDAFEVEAGKEEATALNSPELKWTLGASFLDFGRFTGGLTLRHVDEYYFRSGLNAGVIPSFTTLDAQVGYRLPRLGATLNVTVSNLFTCGGRFTYDLANDPLYKDPTGEERECGFDVRHQEMINMPEIGTMVFVGLRWQR